MSFGALCKATRDTIQAAFTPALTADSCEVGFDGSPKPNCGEQYLAIHPGGWNSVSGDWDLGEEYQVFVTATIRIAFAPTDRLGIAVWLASQDGASTGGLEPLVRKIITTIHHNQSLRIAADTYMTNSGITGGGLFLTPLQFISVSPPQFRGPDWFMAPPPEQDGQVAECGVSQTITFGKCQRVQDIPDME